MTFPRNSSPGAFIALEGPDGCGKSKQIEILQDLLLPDIQVVFTKEPGKDRKHGKKIYEELGNKDPNSISKINPFEFQKWYTADSLDHLNNFVIPAMRLGKTVISDRFRPSLVYGVMSKQEELIRQDIERLMNMNRAKLGFSFVWPGAVIIFDTDPQTCLTRLKLKNRDLDEFEKLETIVRVRRNYLIFAQMYPNCYVIDGNRSVEEVFLDVKKIVLGVIINKYKRRVNL